MRGNSGFLRWLRSSNGAVTNRLFWITLIISILLSSATAGPLTFRSRRTLREVYAEIETQTQNITQPTEGTCLYDGLPVPETSVQCEKKSGCRAIQKTGYCCPDYQCDCERDGKIYANGEKLVDPEEPCKGCYCQGGEILCNSVNCYIRHDCQPKYIAGRCCPEYDNCPPLDGTLVNGPMSTTTTPSSNDITAIPTTPKAEIDSNNPLGIKIKEITKPEEIRIIDEKPKKPTYTLIKPFESSASNQPKIYTPNAVKIEQPPVVVVQTVSGSTTKPVEISSDNAATTGTPPLVQFSESDSTLLSTTQTTIVETSTELNRLEGAYANSITDEDAVKTVRHTDNMPPLDGSTTESTNAVTKEVAANGGKEVFIVESNGESKPITVFGVEGLQRGDILDEVLEFDEKKSAAKRSDVHLDSTTESPVVYSSTEPELIYSNNSTAETEDDFKTVSEIDPIGWSSDDFVRIIATTKVIESTTEGLMDELRQSTGSTSETSTPEEDSGVDDSFATSSVVQKIYRKPDSNAALVASTEASKTQSDLNDDDGDTNEQNPAYPTIGDDVSVYQTQVLENEEAMTTGKDEKILPDVLDFLPNATHRINTTTEVPETWLKQEVNSSSTEKILIDNVSPSQPEERSSGEPLLIPEWERNMTEPANDTLDSLESESFLLNGDSTDLDTNPASGDGPTKFVKEREPTTPNLLRDIDEDGSGRSEYNPKQESESIKYADDSDPMDTGLRFLTSAIEDLRQSSLMHVLALP